MQPPIWNEGIPGGLPRSISGGSLVYDAYRELGVARAGQAVSPEMFDDGFRRLNDMVDSWNTERLFIWSIRRDVYDLTAGATNYVLGDLEETGTRPQLQAVNLLPSGQTGQTMESGLAFLTLDQYRLGQSGFYSDNAYPYAAISFPAASAGDQIVFYSWQRLSGFADELTLYSFPPGYAQAMKWSLAAQLAPSARIYAKYPEVLYEAIEREATRAKAVIKRLNAPVMLMGVDRALRCDGYWDITTGEYR